MRRTAPPTRRNRCLAGWMTPLLLAGAARGQTAPDSPPPPPWPPVCEAIVGRNNSRALPGRPWCYDLTSMRGGGNYDCDRWYALSGNGNTRLCRYKNNPTAGRVRTMELPFRMLRVAYSKASGET